MLNNLEIKKCLCIVAGLNLAFVLLVGIGALGFDVPFVRQGVGFIFLSLIPGALLLRILKIHNVGLAATVIYTVAMSLAFLMFLGFLMNALLPLVGIARPISLLPLIATITISVLVLSLLAYIRDRDYVPEAWTTGSSAWFSAPALLLLLLPLLAISGALLVNHYQNNVILLIFIPAVAAVVALIAFGRFIPEKLYPLAVVAIAIGLLYHTTETLASSFIVGYDIQAELLFQSFVLNSGHWEPATPANLNTALSIVLLSPMYSLLLDMNSVWVFKILYPLFFSLVPLALFLAYRDQIGSRRAFCAAFFFMTLIYFLGLGNRMQIAEVFFALLVLLIAERKLTRLQKSALAIISIIALPVSYYGLAYIALFLFTAGWLVLMLMRNKSLADWWLKFAYKIAGPSNEPSAPAANHESRSPASLLGGNLVALYVVFALSWYMYIASGSSISGIAQIGHHVVSNVNEFFSPVARESLVGTATGADFTKVSILGRGFRIFQYFTQVFIIIGFIRLMLRPWGLRIKAEFTALIMVSAFILFVAIALPYFSGHLEVERFYHFSLFFLAPLCVLGGETIWQSISNMIKAGWIRKALGSWRTLSFDITHPDTRYLGFLALGVLVPYLLFNTGFAFEMAKSELFNVVDVPSSEALSSYRIDMIISNRQEYQANKWLPGYLPDKSRVYADEYGKLQYNIAIYGRTKEFPRDISTLPKDSYIYLRTWNLTRNEVAIMVISGEHIKFAHVNLVDLPALSSLMASKNLIYSNGGAQILAP